MTTRYKLLPNFPKDIVDLAHSEYQRVIGSNLNKFIHSKRIKTIQPNLTVVEVPVDIGLPELKPVVTFLISLPKSGWGIIHTDKSRLSAINIPIQIDLEKGAYITIKEKYINNIPEGSLFELEGKIGYTWPKSEEYFEEVLITHPMFINTSIPHSWNNMDDDYRIVASLSFKEDDPEVTAKIVDKWI